MAIFPNYRSVADIDLTSPVPLNPRNFTSINRTPWAGQTLALGIKKDQATSPAQKIGESWEISCDPDAPSTLLYISSVTLHELISRRTTECLSDKLVLSGRTSLDILVKLINAASPLSLQIHPADDNPLLKPDECGKPESWIVLSAEAGAGLYIGFHRAMTTADIKTHLENGTFTKDLLQFVPVQMGDYFEIEPHVPHAVGPGVVLLEPQRILSGKSGKTWRLWDWNRKYNSAGDLDSAHGKPRDLHINETLSILTPQNQWGLTYVDRHRRKPVRKMPTAGARVDVFPANQWYQTLMLHLDPGAKTQIQSNAGYACATVISGRLTAIGTFGQKLPMAQGESFFIPAASLPLSLEAESTGAQMALVIPAGQGVEPHFGQILI